jgi:hypothetical protein
MAALFSSFLFFFKLKYLSNKTDGNAAITTTNSHFFSNKLLVKKKKKKNKIIGGEREEARGPEEKKVPQVLSDAVQSPLGVQLKKKPLNRQVFLFSCSSSPQGNSIATLQLYSS